MRVVSVIHGPAFGGAHNQALRLAGPLLERGIQLVVVLPEEATGAAERLERGGVPVRRLRLGRLRAAGDPRPNLRLALRLRREIGALAALLEAERADLVQVHGPTNPQAAFAAARGRQAVVWQLLDTRTPRPLRRLLMPAVLRRADAITAWGDAVAREHHGTGSLGDRLISVYPPVDAGEFAPDERARADARRRLGIGADQLCLLSVGVLNPQKGHEHLIRALTLLEDGEERVRVRILGAPSPAHGAHRARLVREAERLGLLASGRLSFLDPGPDVAQLIQAADVFVLPSVRRSEGMPTAVLEAMTAARPVVASDVGATSELVADGRTGILVEPESPAALADALKRLIADPTARARMGAAGRALALESFDLGALADRHSAAYRLALEHRARRGG